MSEGEKEGGEKSDSLVGGGGGRSRWLFRSALPSSLDHALRLPLGSGESCVSAPLVRELPDMMSALEGGGGHGKADEIREVA